MQIALTKYFKKIKKKRGTQPLLINTCKIMKYSLTTVGIKKRPTTFHAIIFVRVYAYMISYLT